MQRYYVRPCVKYRCATGLKDCAAAFHKSKMNFQFPGRHTGTAFRPMPAGLGIPLIPRPASLPFPSCTQSVPHVKSDPDKDA